MDSPEELSKRLNLHLNELGFNEDRIRERIYTANKCSRARDISNKRLMDRNDVEKIFAGSTREGIGCEFLNDLDVLQIDHGVVCQTGNQIPRTSLDGKTYFKIEQNNVPPGYCCLKLINTNLQSESFKRISYAVVKRKKGSFLSSDKFMKRNDDIFKSGKGVICQNTHYLPRQGPSIPKFVEDDMKNLLLFLCNFKRTGMDFVRAFPFESRELLVEWSKRKRPYSWPSDKMINHVISLPVYVVPTGQKGSKTKDIQWRISFIMGEIYLVQNFSNIQTKVFILLKLIAKHILQPVSKNITTYVLKNAMLWLAEQTDPTEFCEDKLIDRLMDALVYIKESVQDRMLPCYMIPQRNLFVGKFPTGEQKLIVEKVNQILEFGKTIASTYYFSHDHGARCKKIDDICNGLSLANDFDKVNSCRLAMFSTEQLAEYFVRMFLCESRWKMISYNTIFHFIPYLYAYGTQGLSDPLNVNLVSKLENEAAFDNERWLSQINIVKQYKPLTNKPSCIATATCTDVFSISSSVVMFLLYNLTLAVLIDFCLFLEIPGFQSFLSMFSDALVRLAILVIFYSTSIIFQFRMTFRRSTFLIRNQDESSEVFALAPAGLINLRNKLLIFMYTLLFLTTASTTCITGTVCLQNTFNFIPNSIEYFVCVIFMKTLHRLF